MCPNFGTPKIINFPFGTNGQFIIFRCPKTEAHYGMWVECCMLLSIENKYFLLHGFLVILTYGCLTYIMDGWICDFTSFLTVFQSYQDDVWMIMKGCARELRLWLSRFHLE